MERKIAHLYIPNFQASLEELRHPDLKRYPLALALTSSRALLQGVNVIAKKEGLREGMPLSQARRMCKLLKVVAPDYWYYRTQHQKIVSLFDRFSPLAEGAFPGHYFIDLTGTTRLWGAATDALYRVEKELIENKFTASAGLAQNKLVSEVAARVVPPKDINYIFPGQEAHFLAPQPVKYLPGVGRKTASLLYDFNVQWIGELARIPEESLSAVCGKKAVRLISLAQGIDSTPVLPSRKNSKISVSHILPRDEIDRELMKGSLLALVENTGWTLRRCNRNAKSMSLELQYADGIIVKGQESLQRGYSNNDHELYQAAYKMLLSIFTRRIAVRRLTLELHRLIMPSRQLSLFEGENEENQLQRAIDNVRTRYGNKAIAWGNVFFTNTILNSSLNFTSSLPAFE